MAQWKLHEAALLSPAMLSASRWLGGGLLMAGAYQWLPIKDACTLAMPIAPRLPVSGMKSGNPGRPDHGHQARQLLRRLLRAEIMALLFVAGVMNLLWVAAIAVFVLAEKAGPGGRALGRATGILMAWGVWDCHRRRVISVQRAPSARAALA